ncbi:SDR family oxidoreductase [Actinomycetota bacterium]
MSGKGTGKLAVVTGASSGIGKATARQLAAEGFEVVCAARRTDRIEELAAEIGGRAVECDVTDPAQVERLREAVGETLHVLVNNAGGAYGADPVESGSVEDWRRMYDVNVIGTLQVTQALLPALEASGEGIIVVVGSTAGQVAYEGGGGYCAAKFGEHALTGALRLEIYDRPVRVTEIMPGMVKSEGFTITRFEGDQAKADAVYAGVDAPLVAEDVADAITWMATRPPHVNIDSMTIRPRAQAAQHKVLRNS